MTDGSVQAPAVSTDTTPTLAAATRGSQRPLDRRHARRMVHRSRSLSAALTALLMAAILAALAAVTLAAGWRASAGEATPAPVDLVPSPSALVGFADGSVQQWVVVAAAAGAGVLGLAAIFAGLAPGIRPRRRLEDARAAVVVDDPVIARHLATEAARGAGVDQRAVGAWISRRRVDLTVTPASGYLPDQTALQAASDATLDELAPRPRPRARVRVSDRGAVGGA